MQYREQETKKVVLTCSIVQATAKVAVLLFIAGAFLSVYTVKVFSYMLQFISHIYVHTVSRNA